MSLTQKNERGLNILNTGAEAGHLDHIWLNGLQLK
jgi:hypothetical protein